MHASSCPACGGSSVEEIGSVGPVPVLCGSLWDSREEALATPTATLDMTVCHTCAHVWNAAFDPALVDYDARYDNALDFSATFRQYADELVDHLVKTFDLRGKRIAEIGSGKGEFLRSLCTAAGGRGVGYDPTYVGPDRDGGIDFVRELFTTETAPGDVDFVVCRHVLEHVEDPVRFLADVRAAVDGGPVPMYFEVPNAEFNFAESGPWDLIYPHVGYFNEVSLRAVLARAGFRVLSVESSYGSQFLSAEVVPDALGQDRAADVSSPRELPLAFRDALGRQLSLVAEWRDRLIDAGTAGGVALWGAGSKGVTFLSLVDESRCIDTVVDANPRKAGRFLPGSGHVVTSPEMVRDGAVSSVLVMNPAYAAEIRSSLLALDTDAEVSVV